MSIKNELVKNIRDYVTLGGNIDLFPITVLIIENIPNLEFSKKERLIFLNENKPRGLTTYYGFHESNYDDVYKSINSQFRLGIKAMEGNKEKINKGLVLTPKKVSLEDVLFHIKEGLSCFLGGGSGGYSLEYYPIIKRIQEKNNLETEKTIVGYY